MNFFIYSESITMYEIFVKYTSNFVVNLVTVPLWVVWKLGCRNFNFFFNY